MTKNILLYYPSNKPSNVIETLALGFVNEGHQVFLLTQSEQGPLHGFLEKQGVSVHSHALRQSRGLVFYWRQMMFLLRFCKRHQIHAIQSHLQQANIVAVIARYFLNIKLVVYRHHLVETHGTSQLFDKIINRLAPALVVPSSVILHKMLQEEKVSASKINLIPYVYDFSRYQVLPQQVEEIRKKHPAKLLVLLCGRFVPLKRNEIAINAVIELIHNGKDIVLLALDNGPGLQACQKLVEKENLSKRIVFVGYTPDALSYIAACDVLVHPSYTEASNNTVKEAALFDKKVIVCEGVGDFSDFIENRVNGYLVNRQDPTPGLIKALEEIYDGKSPEHMGERLHERVLQKFDKTSGTLQKHLDLLLK